MEDRRVNIVASISVITLICIIIFARVLLKLSRAFFLICGAGVSVILAVLVWLLLRLSYNRRRRLLESQLIFEGQELRTEYSFLRKVAGVPTKFKFKELEEATDGFQSLVGKGSSASVFKGVLSDGTSIAVKRINALGNRGEKEFRSEVAAIASVHHVNLVRLLGYCNAPSAPRYLVYEFISNGSLDCWIFPKKENQSHGGRCLSWNLRYKVAIDVAKGLAYLHHDCRSRILHLDIKPENILLDETYRGMVSDFGLSKLIGKDENKVVSTIRGTRGYLAPEWLLEQGISDKTDVYSYGMVLLEIIGGRKNMCLVKDEKDVESRRKWQHFPKIVNEKVREGKFMEIVDHRLMACEGVDEREVRTLVFVALWCVQERPRLRPNMVQVVDMLEGRVRVEEPPDTRMIHLDLLNVDEESTANCNNMPRLLDSMSSQRTHSIVDCTSTYNSFIMSGR
ncbi:probable receptor-like protein kinase At5g20050 [Lotus japonicus]|uniref:probable receptor-like protein kinase At5g20050 n=1 Tax=Lotus japonicus TaxID=34305 RepID=UPI00258C0405|nr:probable receptor-like protein kinase At5g20050 [Lotus japonicus]